MAPLVRRSARMRSRTWSRTVAGLAPFLAALVAGPPAHAAVPRGASLRVMSYNIQAGAGADHVFDLERQARAIEAQHPDVVGLEEVDVAWGTRSDYGDEASWL